MPATLPLPTKEKAARIKRTYKKKAPSKNVDKLLRQYNVMVVLQVGPNKGKEVVQSRELYEIWRENVKGELTLRGYEVHIGKDNYYYGPAFYDTPGDINSCLNMAKRKLNDPDKPHPWPRIAL